MLQVAGHLEPEELRAGYRSSRDVTLARHYEVIWAPRGERPVARCHHRVQRLYVTAFVSHATGESFFSIRPASVNGPGFPPSWR